MVSAAASGQGPHLLGQWAARLEDVGGAHRPGQRELVGQQVDRHDLGRTGEPGALHHRQANAADPDDEHGLLGTDTCGVEHGADPQDAVPDLTADEREVLAAVAAFVDRSVRPVARELERSGAYPEQLLETMKRMGVFGLQVPAPYGDIAVSARCFALVSEELARGWMSLSGAIGGHAVVANLLRVHGTPAQRQRYLPRMATGELRATMALTEPSGGSDLQAMRTRARGEGDGYVVDGAKTWITNARRAGLIALLCKTDPDAQPDHRGISVLLVEREAGYTVGPDLGKLGYRGVESCEVSFDGVRVPADALLGEQEGQGFAQMLRGLEIGRIQVSARAVGVARAAPEDATRYAQQREAFGKPIWQHQSVGNLLADMATRPDRGPAAGARRRRPLRQRAALRPGGRHGQAFASEACMQITMDAMRVLGGNGFSTDYDVERYYRDPPLMVLGEGTNEIQRSVIARQWVQRSAAGSPPA